MAAAWQQELVPHFAARTSDIEAARRATMVSMPGIYTYDGPINRGGFGRVERVRGPNVGLVARKVFDPRTQLPPDDLEKFKRRFRREVRVQSQLPSDFFIPILDWDLDADPPWFTMPLAESNYEAQITADQNAGVISPEPLADILNALEALHSLGYTHRDLKPGNVLKHDGRWKLSDLGLVLPPDGATARLTSTDSAWGTREYAAPEQAVNFHHVTPVADIYAFGCMLHDLVGGERIPFSKITVDGPLGMIIEKCTEVQAAKRFKNIAGLRGALMAVLASPLNAPRTPATEEWVAKLHTKDSWDLETLRSFVRYIERNADQLGQVFVVVDEDVMARFRTLDEQLFDAVAEAFCGWASSNSFPWQYCDVLGRRLENIYALGSIGTKAAAILATAQLGHTHNRFFVMRLLHGMASPELDDNVARRVAIEIQAEERGWNFYSCARGVSTTTDVYHPIIRAVVPTEPPPLVR